MAITEPWPHGNQGAPSVGPRASCDGSVRRYGSFCYALHFWLQRCSNADAALDPVQRDRTLPHSRLKGQANVLIFPSLDAANIAYESIRVLADALPVGPILIGAARPVHVLTASTTARGVVNMTAVAVVEAQAEVREQAAE